MKTGPVQESSAISPHALQQRRGKSPCCLVDVRTAPEFAASHVSGAQLLPLDEITAEQVAALRGSADAPVYLICQSGMRARKAKEKLAREGCDDCTVVDGGMEAWQQAGLPVERGTTRVLPLMRQVQLVIGVSTATGAILALAVDPWFALVPLVTGCGLTINGLTGFCGLALLMARLPWNKRAARTASCCA